MGGGDGGALPRVVLPLGGDVLDERDEATGAAVRRSDVLAQHYIITPFRHP